MDKLLTVPDVAQACAVSPRTVMRWIASRRLRCVRLGRVLRVSEGAVERMIREATRG